MLNHSKHFPNIDDEPAEETLLVAMTNENKLPWSRSIFNAIRQIFKFLFLHSLNFVLKPKRNNRELGKESINNKFIEKKIKN